MITVADILAIYRADRAPVVVVIQRIDSTINPLLRLLGHHAAATLRRADVAHYVAQRLAEGVQPPTARRELVTLRAALRCAWREGLIDRVPPLPMPPPGAPRQRVLSPPEIRTLRGACASDPRLAIFLDVLLGIGARRGAVSELTWDRVDFAARTIDLRAPHPRAARRKRRAFVPMPSALATRLRDWQRNPLIPTGRG